MNSTFKIPNKILILISSFLAANLGSIATAEPIATNKDWMLEDLGTVCVASTQRVIEAQTYRLELALDKSGVFPVETLLRLNPDIPDLAANFVYDQKKNVVYQFARQTDAVGNFTYWQVPRGTEALISYLKRGNSFSVNLTSASVPTLVKVDFSLRGSSATLEALSAKCAGNRALTSSDFEKNFLDLNKLAVLDPAKLRPDQVALIRNAYFNGYAADAAKKIKEKELAALTAKYAKQIGQLAKLEGTLDQLTQKELAALNVKKEQTELKIKELETLLQTKQAEIAARDQELQVANANYDAAWQQLAPLEPEHKRLNSLLVTAQNELGSAKNRLSRIDGDISNYTNQIQNLESESANKRSRLNTIESDIDRSRREYDQASREANGFNESTETAERLRRDSGYESAKRDIQRLQRDGDQARREEQRSQREANQAERGLQQCNSKPEPRNCFSEQSQVQQARSEEQRARQQTQRIENEIRQRESALQLSESRVQEEVRSEGARLRQRVEQARTIVSRLETEVTELERRIRDINQFDIPALQNKITSLRGERPGVVSNIGDQTTEVANKKAALETYKQSVGYDAKKAAVDTTAGEVSRVKKEISKLESQKTQINADTATQKKSLDATMKSIEKTLAAIQETTGKSTELKNLLQPYFDQKAPIDAELANQTAKFEAAKVAFNQEL